MAGKSSQSGNRGSDLFGLLVSGKIKEFHTSQSAAPVPASGHVATGGIISDYTHPNGNVYRAHVFTNSGAFTVTSVGTISEYCRLSSRRWRRWRRK